MKSNHLLSIFLTGLILVLVTSCKKSPDISINQRSGADNALASNLFMDVFLQVDEAAKNEAAVNKTEGLYTLASSVCANISVTTSSGNYPVSLEIDFGNGCLGSDGRFRKGKIKAVFSGRYTDIGTQVTISLDHYFVNAYRIEGTKTLLNKGINAAGFFETSILVSGGKVVSPEKDSVEWNCDQLREWVSGDTTYQDISDDTYFITGSSTGINANGEPFSATIKEALKIEASCKWPLQGKLSLVAQNNTEVEVDYAPDGIATCNQSAAIIINGKMYNFTMY